MSGIYWGIVSGLVAMVATFFLCIALLYSNAKGSPTAPSGRIDEPREADTPTSAGRDHRSRNDKCACVADRLVDGRGERV
jgi:hypothetical protein